MIRASYLGWAAALLVVLCNTSPPEAHLALIRQQYESQGVLEAGERTGTALAFGDFDNDGLDDLATGAPDDPQGTASGEVGTVIINYGDTWGLTHVGAQVLLFDTSDTNGRFGQALAAGDFDGDGDDDLAVGHPGRDLLSTLDTGALHIYEGDEIAGLAIFPALTLRQEDLGEVSEPGDLFGWSLAVGRFDDDVYDDLAVSAVGEDGDIGRVFVLFGSAAGLVPTSAITFTADDLGGSGFFGDRFGHALAAGHLLDSEQDDLAIGVPFSDIGVVNLDAGRTYVVPGGPTGLQPALALILTAASLGESPATGGQFGWALVTGRLQEDVGALDLAIGEPGFPSDSWPRAGRVLVTDLEGPAPFVALVLDHGSASGGISADEMFGFALATGDADGDGDDELAVGVPGEDSFAPDVDVGEVAIFQRDDGDLTDTTENLDGRELHDVVAGGWELGSALAYGKCDAFDRASLAVGAPGADYRIWREMEDLGVDPAPQAGQVHIYASWRQAIDLQSRSSVALNCQGDLIYAQRPFDPLAIASTTKTMTVYLACLAITTATADSNEVTEIGDWVVDCFQGSDNQFDPVATDQWRLIDLMRVAMWESSGSACYKIAQVLTDYVDDFPPTEDCPDDGDVIMPTFVSQMNAKADDLGMNDTFFTNPHGSTSGSAYGGNRHHSSAYDMALLGRAAMTNPLFAEIVGSKGQTIQGTFYSNGFLTSFDNWNPLVVGVKGGFNTYARLTIVGAADDPILQEPPAIATVMGVETTTLRYRGAAALLNVALGQCEGPGPGGILPPPPPDDRPYLSWIGVPVERGTETRGGPDLDAEGGDVLVEAGRWIETDDPATLELTVARDTWRHLDMGETATFGIAPFAAHDGFRLYNTGSATTYFVTLNEPPGTTLTLNLASGEDYEIAAHDAAGGTGLVMTIQNLSSVTSASLVVEEHGYDFDLELGNGGALPSSFSALLTRDTAGEIEYDDLRIAVVGQDATPGNTVTVEIRDPDGPTSIPEDGDLTEIPAPHPSLEVWPNPFNPATNFTFELAREGTVRLVIHDLAGKRVAELVRETLPAGTHTVTWRGLDAQGRAVASGTYFARLETSGGVARRKLTLIR